MASHPSASPRLRSGQALGTGSADGKPQYPRGKPWYCGSANLHLLFINLYFYYNIQALNSSKYYQPRF